MAAEGEPGEIFGRSGVAISGAFGTIWPGYTTACVVRMTCWIRNGYSRPFPPQKPVVRQSTRRR